jgi:hypothetical protein
MVSILQSWCLHLTLRTQCSTNLSLPSSSSFYGSPVPPAKAQTSHHSLCDLAADTSPVLCCLLSLLTPGSSEFQFAVPPHRSLFSMLWNPVPRRPPPGGPPCPEGCVRAPLGAPPSLPAHSRLSLGMGLCPTLNQESQEGTARAGSITTVSPAPSTEQALGHGC